MSKLGLKENIKAYRLLNNMTLEEVANRLGVSRPTVQRYESGAISNIPPEKVEKLSEIFSVSPSMLMGWNDDKRYFDFYTNDIIGIANNHKKNIEYELKRLYESLSLNSKEFTDDLYRELSQNIITDFSNKISKIKFNEILNDIDFINKLEEAKKSMTVDFISEQLDNSKEFDVLYKSIEQSFIEYNRPYLNNSMSEEIFLNKFFENDAIKKMIYDIWEMIKKDIIYSVSCFITNTNFARLGLAGISKALTYISDLISNDNNLK